MAKTQTAPNPNRPVETTSKNWADFIEVVRTRRSVRKFADDPIAEQDMHDILDAAILAPSSSNLQPFEFIWVRSPRKKEQLVKACLSQNAAKTAAELVVCVARWDEWDETRRELIAWLGTQTNVPGPVKTYYEKGAQVLYSRGPLGVYGAARRAALNVAGQFRPVPRGPVSREDMRVWAVKSAALCCENLMLAARAKGFDSCPMEGNDPVRVGELVGYHKHDWLKTWDVPMVIGLGYRGPRGLWGEQWRRERSKLIREA